MAKMAAKQPDVIAFNGYANQYKDNPIAVAAARRSACTCSTRARASGAPST